MGNFWTVDTSGDLNTAGSIVAAGGISSTSTTAGLLPPAMTTTQRNAIVSPADGLLVYDITLHQLWEYQNGAWVEVGSGSGVISLNSLTGALSIVGTSNEITVTPSGSNITLSTPQAINTGASVTFAHLALSGLTNSTVVVTDGADNLVSSSTTTTELGYVHGVTSNIQTQINALQPSGNYITALTGDATASGPGSATLTLATVNVSPGSTTISSITTNAKGLVTANTSASTTGSGDVVLATSPTLVTPNLGTPSSLILTNATGTPTSIGLANGTGLSLTTGVTGILPIANGGTNSSTSLTNGLMIVSSGGKLVEVAADTSMGANKITSLKDPTSAQDAATKNYVDNSVNGLDWKAAVLVATTTGLPAYIYNNGSSGVGATITAVSTGTVSIDGHTLALNDRILIKNETSTNTPYNGIYNVTQAGAVGVLLILTRATDYNQSSEIQAGDAVYVQSGTVNSTTSWVQSTSGTIIVGTTNIVFSQASGPGAITINGTPNQIIALTTGTTTTLSTPQNIATTSSPTFAGEILTNNSADATIQFNNNSEVLTMGWVNSTTEFIMSGSSTLSGGPQFLVFESGNILDIGGGVQLTLINAGIAPVSQGLSIQSGFNFVFGGSGTFTMAAESGITFNDAGSPSHHSVTIQAPSAISTNYSLNLPTAQGAASTFLQNDGSGNLSWQQGGGVGYREDYIVGTALNNYTGSLTVFNLVNAYNVGGHTLIVTLDGDVQTIGSTVDYLETNSTTVTFNNSLVIGQKVSFIFSQAPSSPSGNVNSGTANQLAYYATSTNAVSGSTFLTTDNANNLTIGTGGAGSNNVTTTINYGATSSIGRINFDQNGSVEDFIASVGANGLNISSGVSRSTILTINGSTVLTVAGSVVTSAQPLAMSANKITGLANGTASTDAAAFGQIYTGFQALVQASGTSSTSLTTNSWVSTVVTASITPTSASHRIKVTAAFTVVTASNNAGRFQIYRNTTNLQDATNGALQVGNNTTAMVAPVTLVWIDSPSTTSSTTYTVYGIVPAAAGTVTVGNSQTWTINLEEIV